MGTFVTGASGFIGSNLVRKLSDQGEDISIFIKPNTWHPFLDDLDLRVFYGDIRNKGEVRNAMRGCNRVYQVAGVVSYDKVDDQEVYTTHVDGVRNVLEAAIENEVEGMVVIASTAGIGYSEDGGFL